MAKYLSAAKATFAGVDIIRVDEHGKIAEFRVMVRPLQALNTVHHVRLRSTCHHATGLRLRWVT